MPRSDRLFRLLQAMRVMPAPITAQALAEETDVSLRTLYRDIDSLRLAGARIEGERGYGYRLTEDSSLPPQMLNRAEMEALALGLSAVERMADESFAKSARAVLAKVAATLPGDREQQLFHAISKVYRPTQYQAPSIDMDLLRRACWDERAVHIHYRDAQDRTSERTIYPLALVYDDPALTILAWCCMRDDFRMFRTDRIQSLQAGTESFRPRRVALLRDYLNQIEERRAEFDVDEGR